MHMLLNYDAHVTCNHIDIVQRPPGNITNTDLATLNGPNWLNDQVMKYIPS